VQGDGRQETGGFGRRASDSVATGEAAPVSWPLVERRRLPQVTSTAFDRRQSRPPTADVATIESAPLTPFRIAAFVGSIIRSIDGFSWTDWWLLASAAVVAAYTLFATVNPVPYTNDARSRMRTMIELGIVTTVVVVSGGWASPFALCLVPTAMLASFVGGTAFSTKLVVVSSALITLDHLRDVGTREGFPDAALWTGLLILVTITSGLSHRTAQESANQQQAALDRVGRLAEANALLFSLQRVAQTLPASLDLDEVLDSTVTRVQSLIDHSMLTVLLQGDVAGRLEPVRVTGYQSTGALGEADLPSALLEALRAPKTVRRDEVVSPTACLAPMARSGLYAALRARGSVVGLIAVESLEPHHFGQQQAEILHGLAEPFGIAIDNARLFRRLRIVSADEERNRIARDLHDHIGSSLAFLGFEIDRCTAAAGRGEPVDAALKELRVQVTSMVGEVRETLYDLRSDVSETQDLTSTLRQFVDRVRGRSGLDISFVSDQRVRLSLVHERELWHIAREALINVERHAQATQASMEWICTPSHASLTIRDNGVGMLFGAGRVDSYGIKGMRERADAIGAKMTTESSPTGTVIRVGLHQPKGSTTWD
jgi:signal transduction histidine kinase